MKIRHIKRCFIFDKDFFLARRYPFAHDVVFKNYYNQIGISMEKEDAIRIEGWDFTTDDNLYGMLDAVIEFAKENNCSRVFYLGRLSDTMATYLTNFNFKKVRGYKSERQFVLEVMPG